MQVTGRLPAHALAGEVVELIYSTFTDSAADHKPMQGDDDVDHHVFQCSLLFPLALYSNCERELGALYQ